MNYKQIDDAYVAHTYGRYDVCITHGEQSTLCDINNHSYIDFTSGIGVNSLGYNHNEWVKAICEQATKLAHISNLYYTTPMLSLASSLCEKSGMKKVFFANSGAEANEGAIKVARKYANHKYNGKRSTILTLTNSFHGRTMTTLSATGQDVFHKDFDPFMQGFDYVEANNINDLEHKVSDDTLAIMIEIVQGEGGVLPLDIPFMNKIKQLCNQNDILLIVDEVQTGIGRCGSLFAYQQFNLTPDIVTSAKGLGNGLPIGAILLGDKCEDVLTYGDHGTTFGANPIACAGANVVMSYMNEEMYAQVLSKGNYIKTCLLTMKHVKKVNGLGLMLGVELEGINAKELVNKCIEKGVLFLSAKENLRLLPPLTISDEQIDKGLQILNEVLDTWEV